MFIFLRNSNYERTTRRKKYVCVGGNLRIGNNDGPPQALELPGRVRKTVEQREAERIGKDRRAAERHAKVERLKAQEAARKSAQVLRLAEQMAAQRITAINTKHQANVELLQKKQQQLEKELQQRRKQPRMQDASSSVTGLNAGRPFKPTVRHVSTSVSGLNTGRPLRPTMRHISTSISGQYFNSQLKRMELQGIHHILFREKRK